MKNFLTKRLAYALTVAAFAMVVTSCTEDAPNVPAPVADFTFDIDGTTVTFTNTSTDGKTYFWEFGNDETSTDASPTHDYGRFGGFLVDLTATNESGTNTKSADVQVVPEISIDGLMADWTEIAVAATRSTGNDGAVSTIKIVSKLTYIYVFVEGSNDLGGFISMYLNSDGDTTTGWAPKNHVLTEEGAGTSTGAGADFEIRLGGPWPGTSDFSAEVWTWVEDGANVDQAERSFEGAEVGSEDMFIMPRKTGNSYEFAILRGSFPGGIVDTFSFLFVDVDINQPPPAEDWIETGYLPNDYNGFIEHELFK